MRQPSAERIHHHEDRRSHHHRRHHRPCRTRRQCCGTERPCCAGEDTSEEGCHPEEGRAQGPESRQGWQGQAAPKKDAKAGKKAAKPAPAKEASTPRAESKGAKILELISRPKGASLIE